MTRKLSAEFVGDAQMGRLVEEIRNYVPKFLRDVAENESDLQKWDPETREAFCVGLSNLALVVIATWALQIHAKEKDDEGEKR